MVRLRCRSCSADALIRSDCVIMLRRAVASSLCDVKAGFEKKVLFVCLFTYGQNLQVCYYINKYYKSLKQISINKYILFIFKDLKIKCKKFYIYKICYIY